MIQKLLAPVVANTALSAPGHYVLAFSAPEIAAVALPGQFIAVRDTTNTQLLRRPFSIFTADTETGICSILFSVYGPTTTAMAALQPGDLLDCIGPLGGRVFTPDERPNVHHILVGGGYGVPPLVFLARRLQAANPVNRATGKSASIVRKTHEAHLPARITFINGARTKAFLVGTEGLEEIGVSVLSCTDDGTCGIHGRVTVALEPILATGEPCHVYTCGPTPMMQAVGERAIAHSTPCQVSMETFMPCGIGICMGCAVPLKDGTFARGCTDGPVFSADTVRW